jgi:GTPase Era involved in 16S rRNA processing|tara:strand:+ start:86 stop:418 length:333 start_codon:yes stop_codon:yes gene_type:complete
MSFFKSDLVQQELEKISQLQEEIYTKIYMFSNMNKEDKLYHVELLEELLNKQRILYTRMSLSDDPDAKKMKENIVEQAQMLGFPPDTDIAYVFGNMTKIIENMKKSIRDT